MSQSPSPQSLSQAGFPFYETTRGEFVYRIVVPAMGSPICLHRAQGVSIFKAEVISPEKLPAELYAYYRILKGNREERDPWETWEIHKRHTKRKKLRRQVF